MLGAAPLFKSLLEIVFWLLCDSTELIPPSVVSLSSDVPIVITGLAIPSDICSSFLSFDPFPPSLLVPNSFCFDEGEMYSGFSHDELSRFTSSSTRVRSAGPAHMQEILH